MRLAKFLAHAGVASRRHSERLIASGRVAVDGTPVTDPAFDVQGSSVVAVDGDRVEPEQLEYHLVHKPVGVVSTADDPQGRPKITDLVRSGARLYPVGRLDVDTSGAIILTNDGSLANLLTHPRYEVPKTYHARVEGAPAGSTIDALRSGVELEDGPTAAAEVDLIKRRRRESVVRITIHEGRKRQVRRMLESVGHPVIELHRTRIGALELGSLPSGGSRKLTDDELARLRREES
jgi:23S rRNA pseudouridine2605 synthase